MDVTQTQAQPRETESVPRPTIVAHVLVGAPTSIPFRRVVAVRPATISNGALS
jgi:hypothetical protein